MDFEQLLENYFFQNPFVGITVTDGQGKCLMVNDTQTRITGISKDKILGRNLRTLMAEDVFSISSTIKVLETKKEVNIQQATSSGRSYEVKGVPVFGENGAILYVVSYLMDIKMAEEFCRFVKENDVEKGQGLDSMSRILKMVKEKNGIIHNSKRIDELVEFAIKIAASEATVLITGQSGTGKELFANLIHQNSSRSEKPFIKLNCAAIPENLFESELFGYDQGAFTGGRREGNPGIFIAADGGSLFLDEICEMPLQLQAKLLRVLQEKEVMHIGSSKAIKVDVRIIAATNASLLVAVQEKRFREDLYYRLNVINIHVPNLGERKEDIPVLIVSFIKEYNENYGLNKKITQEAIDFLSNRKYPGNVRELKNIVERLVLQGDTDVIGIKDTFELCGCIGIDSGSLVIGEFNDLRKKSLKELMEDYEKQILKGYLEFYGKPEEIARHLSIDRSTLSRKFHKYRL